MCQNNKSIIIILPNNCNIQNVFFKYSSQIKFSLFVLFVNILGKNKLFLRYLSSNNEKKRLNKKYLVYVFNTLLEWYKNKLKIFCCFKS